MFRLFSVSIYLLGLILPLYGYSLSSLTREEKVNSVFENTEKTERTSLFSSYARPSVELNLEQSKQKDVGEPLFLTPYIKAGRIKAGRKASLVELPDDVKDVRSYSGLLTLDEEKGSNMFFWFFPAETAPHTAPLLVWLQGGPGGSSLFGLFAENGPFVVRRDMGLGYRNYTWTREHNVLYFDNPVGTGFSFTRDGYCSDEVCVGNGLYNATQQFLELFPELRHAPFFVTGESYAGKYVPALAYMIHKYNPTAEKKINLKGIAIGDGLCDPPNMLDYGNMLLNYGLINANQNVVFQKKQRQIAAAIRARDWLAAFKGFDVLLNGDTIKYPSMFTNATGLTYYYNYVEDVMPADMSYFESYVNQPDVREAIHVGNLTFHDGKQVERHLLTDVMQSMRPWIQTLLDEPSYRVVIYSGQVDVIIGYPLTKAFVRALDWAGADGWSRAPRHIWKVDGAVAGYVQEFRNFAEVLVRSAGHMVPYDQPARAYDLIRRVTGVNTDGFTAL